MFWSDKVMLTPQNPLKPTQNSAVLLFVSLYIPGSTEDISKPNFSLCSHPDNFPHLPSDSKLCFPTGRLSIAILLSCKAGFGHDMKAIPPHRSQAELPVPACSSTGMEVLSIEVQPIDPFLDHSLLASLVSCGRPAFDAPKLTPHQPPTQGTETQK